MPVFTPIWDSAISKRAAVAEAIAELREATRLDPRSASAHYDLGTLLLRERQYGEARGHFESAVAPEAGLCRSAQQSRHRPLHRGPPRGGDPLVPRGAGRAGRERRGPVQSGARVGSRPSARRGAGVVSGSVAAEAGGCRYPRLDRERARERWAASTSRSRTTGWRSHRIPIWPAALVDLAWILATSDRVGARAGRGGAAG